MLEILRSSYRHCCLACLWKNGMEKEVFKLKNLTDDLFTDGRAFMRV